MTTGLNPNPEKNCPIRAKIPGSPAGCWGSCAGVGGGGGCFGCSGSCGCGGSCSSSCGVGWCCSSHDLGTRVVVCSSSFSVVVCTLCKHVIGSGDLMRSLSNSLILLTTFCWSLFSPSPAASTLSRSSLKIFRIFFKKNVHKRPNVASCSNQDYISSSKLLKWKLLARVYICLCCIAGSHNCI